MKKERRNLADFTPEQRTLLELQLQKKREHRQRQQTIARRQNRETAPLSFAQQRLWFLHQMEPDNPFYNLPTALRITGPLDVEALQRSMQEIIERHEILRTSFQSTEDEPIQVIQPAWQFLLPVIDVRAEPEPQEVVSRFMQGEAQKPFDLSRLPLLRASLLRSGEAEHILVLSMHHIISDGWSMGILIHELTALYEAYVSGTTPILPDLPVQYADFAVWQRAWLQGTTLEEQVRFWKQRLAGIPAVLELPADHPRPPRQSYQGRTHWFTFPLTLAERIRSFSQQEKTTPFALLLAAFSILLYRYTGQDDVVVGSPVANRTISDIERVMGFFVNTLVMRTDLSGEPTLREVVQQVRQAVIEVYEHQHLPFEKLVEELKPERNLSYSPICQIMFHLQNVPPEPLEAPRLALTPVPSDTSRAIFDLSLSLQDTGTGEMLGWLDYSTDLFEESTIVRFLDHYQLLLTRMLSNPDTPIAAISMLSSDELALLLVQWNQTSCAYPQQSLARLFEKLVEEQPDMIALQVDSTVLSYRELNSRANRLAHFLCTHGAGPDVLVGLCLERSVELVIALLAIQKAGSAYVPLDPAYPEARLKYMVETSQLKLVLTQENLADRPCLRQVPGLCLDSAWQTVAGYSDTNPVPDVLLNAEHLAYVMYTSGSTGRPKGVAISRRALMSFLQAVQQELDLTPSDVLLAVISISFDLAGLDIYLPLLTGARLVLATHQEAASGDELAQLLERYAVTILQATPVTWRLLLDAGWTGRRPFKALSGGEALPLDLARQLLPRVDELWNGYGPTETTIWSTLHQVQDGEPLVPIGRPLDNTKIYILDNSWQPVPVGVPGDLYIGGMGVARFYWQQPDATAEKFLPDPFGPQPGATLYSTGDLARYLPDGRIEFLGRRDQQVKFHGFRIELGEIEQVLNSHPRIRESVVVLREDIPGDKKLTAYIRREADPGSEEITEATVLDYRMFLLNRLPGYMIPQAFAHLDSFPLTPSGKIARQALPAPDKQVSGDSKTFVAPRTPLEQTIAGIWSDLLGVEPIGIHTNFFFLGGHSLLATRVVTRLRQQCHVEVPVRAIFESPTIAELAAVASSLQEPEAQTIITHRITPQAAQHLLNHFEELSEEQVEVLLSQMLAEQ